MAITHSFVSGKGDDPDATLVDGTAWDAAHSVSADTVTEAMLSTADNTTKNASASKHGFLAKLSGSSTDYVGGDNACHALPGEAGVFINVTDAAYGATGDGVTDDYDAIILAFDTAVYSGTVVDTTQDTSGGVFNNTTDPLSDITISSHGCVIGDFIKIEDEVMCVTRVDSSSVVHLRRGAAGTTTAAHANGISIYRSAAVGGSTVYFPRGVYLLGSELVVPGNITLQGTGYGHGGVDTTAGSWLKGNIQVTWHEHIRDLRLGADTYRLRAYGQPGTFEDVHFERCEFIGGTTDNNQGVVHLGLTSGGTYPWQTIKNWSFTDCLFQRSLQQGNNVRIDEDTDNGSHVEYICFRGCTFGSSNGAATGSYKFNVEVYQNTAATTRITGFEHIDFYDCIFKLNDQAHLDYSGAVNSADSTEICGGNSVVQGCLFEGCSTDSNAFCLQAEPAHHLTIANNIFWTTRKEWFKSIKAYGAYTGNTIVGNTFDMVTDHSTSVTPSSAVSYITLSNVGDTFSGNTIHLNTVNTVPTFYVTGAKNVVTGNTVIDKSTHTDHGPMVNLSGTSSYSNIFSSNYFECDKSDGATVTESSTPGKNFFFSNVWDVGVADPFSGTSNVIHDHNYDNDGTLL